MGITHDLDEVPLNHLMSELQRRRECWEVHRCDYCDRARTETPCKFPDRHKAMVTVDAGGLFLQLVSVVERLNNRLYELDLYEMVGAHVHWTTTYQAVMYRDLVLWDSETHANPDEDYETMETILRCCERELADMAHMARVMVSPEIVKEVDASWAANSMRKDES